MGMHYLIQAIFVLVGLLSVLAALFNWEWFFTAHNTQFIVSNAGRQRARLFYAILGLLIDSYRHLFLFECYKASYKHIVNKICGYYIPLSTDIKQVF